MQQNRNTSDGPTILFDVWLLFHLTEHLLDAELREVGLTADEFGLCSLLHSFGPLSTKQICDWTGLRQTTTSGVTRRLEQRGHLARNANPQDARSTLVDLTDVGREATTAGARRLAARLPGILHRLPTPEADSRSAMAGLDASLRHAIGASPRPDQSSTSAGAPAGTIAYPGRILTTDERTEVETYIAWVQHRSPA